ncbi:uncharacterized protein LOC144153484 [Haemaphysalis longicornis]
MERYILIILVPFLICSTQMSYCHRVTGERAQFAFCVSSAFIRTTFRRPPSLYNIDSCVLRTTRLKVLKPSLRSPDESPAYWSAMLFRENVKASSVRYPGSTTIPEMSRHLRHLKWKFGNVRDALVLFFQEKRVVRSVAEAVHNEFSEAAAILGTSILLDLDVNRYIFNLEPAVRSRSSDCLCTQVIVVLLGFR